VFRIICDFDGTITITDVVDQLLEEFAAPEWQAIEQEWLKGDINSRECLSRQVALLRAQRHQLTRFLHQVVIDSAFPAFAEFCAAHKLPLMIVSDGFDIVVRQVLARHGLGYLPVIANRLELCTTDRWFLRCPYANNHCRVQAGVCKCQVVGVNDKQTILIGDGRSDTCIARRADIVLAKGYLADYCTTERIAHLQISSFADAFLILQQLLSYSVAEVLVYH
jgi:2-hydroxy-3-keto-5-methylthiopentenyl-1-phosphate phosphatase